MDAYIFGNHTGDLPTDLLASSGGNRVRAMARLDGPTHDVFYALEVEDPDGVSVITETLTKHGLVVSGTHIAATNQDKVAMHVVPHITPSHMPPWEYYLFLHVEQVEKVPSELGDVLADLGEGTVAAALDTDANLLIELGGNDEAALVAAGTTLTNALGSNVSTHAVIGDGILTG